MILTYGNIGKLKGKDWYYAELRSDRTVENTLRRIGKSIPGIFRQEAIEVFIPVTRRDLDVFDLETSVYIFVRSTHFPSLLRLKSVTGVVSLVTEGETSRPYKAISVPDGFVQGCIKKAERLFYERAMNIRAGSFVRILDGETRDYCGHVLLVGDGKACVKVDLKTKSLLVETPLRNLLNLSHVPEAQRVFYYSPLVAQLAAEGGAALVAEDLKFTESPPGKAAPEAREQDREGPKRYTRLNTATALVKRLVGDGVHDPIEIAAKVVRAIKAKDIKAPKNLLIVYCIIKSVLMKMHLRKLDPQLRNYRDAVKRFGKPYRFSPSDIAAIDPNVGVPVTTPCPAKDGRSREARERKRRLAELGGAKGGLTPPPKKRKIKSAKREH